MTNEDVLRKLKGLTLTNSNREIENMFGLPKNSLSNFISGKKAVPKKYHERIFKKLDLTDPYLRLPISQIELLDPKDFTGPSPTIPSIFEIAKGNFTEGRVAPMTKREALLEKVVSVMKVYNCDIEDIIDVFVASKQPLPEPKIEKATQQSSADHKAEIAALKSEIAALGKDWIANKRRKQIEAKIKSLGGTQ
jgi:transcriptional regulator with XRE-family HTH domain